MSYSKLYFKEKIKIPTFLIIISVLISSIFMGSVFFSLLLPLRASKKTIRRIEVTNTSPTQAAIFWQTDKKELGWIIFGEKKNNLDKIILDERDSSNKKNEYLNHYSVIKNLKENTEYFFKIVSNNELVNNINGEPYSFKTTLNIKAQTGQKPAYGKVIKKNGESLENSLVLLFIEGTNPLSVLTQSSGGFLISLNNIFDKITNKSKIIDKNEKIRIEIFSEEGEISTVFANLPNLSPLPQTVVIGRNYEFTDNVDDVLSASSVNEKEKVTNNSKIDIIYPKENAMIEAGYPLIRGIALPESEILIIVNSKSIFSIKTKAKIDGSWKVDLPNSLSFGEHTISMITRNEKNEEIKISRRFIILKSGERVLGQATASATPTEKPPISPTLTPTIVTTVVPTQTIPTISPTAPPTGPNPIFFILPGLSLIVIGSGLLLAF